MSLNTIGVTLAALGAWVLLCAVVYTVCLLSLTTWCAMDWLIMSRSFAACWV